MILTITLLLMCWSGAKVAATLIVEITPSGGDTVAGEQYSLTCTVTVPESSGLSGTPTVVWTGDEGKEGVTEGTAETSGRVTILTLTFDPLQDSQDGDYTCSATLPVSGMDPVIGMNVYIVDAVAPEVTVTVSATGGAPIVGGSSYSLTCDHDAPQSLMATVQSTLTTPNGTILTSLPHTFNPLRVTDGGQYSCSATVSSPYLTDDFPATQGTTLDVVVEIPSPGVEASANATGSVFAGTVLTLTCTISLDGGLSSMLNDLSVTTVWTQDEQEVSTGGNIMVSGAVFAVSTTYSSILSFNTVHTDDAGDYTCAATVSPSVPFSTVLNGVGCSDPPVTVSVNVPTITVSLEPNTTRLPTEPPYNTFTITCTATAPEGVVAGKTIEWKKRIGTRGGLTPITNSSNGIQIVTTNPNQPETTSVLTVTKTTPGNYRYRCRVDITELSIDNVDGDVYPINVIGPTPPEKPTNLMDISTSSDSATIQWTVLLVAFTPETYVVHYGTNMGSLNLMSGAVESGDDFVAENTLFTVQLNGLHPGTLYYYQVSATNSNTSTLSDIQLFQTGDQPPGSPPQNVRLLAETSSSVLVTWLEPDVPNGVIILYTVYVNGSMDGTTEATVTMYTITGLLPYQLVIVSVSAHTAVGEGPESTAYSVRSKEAVPPDGPPLNFEITVQGPRTLTFSWDPPSEDLRNGVITGYLLTCDPQLEGLRMTYEQSDGVNITVGGFIPSTTYHCSVYASTSAGDGPPASDSVTIAMIFQLQLTGIHNCREWVSLNADDKVSDIHTAMQHDIEHLCMCGFTTQHLSDSELQCFMNLEEVTFRSLIIGTAQATSSELIEYIEQWIAGGPRILVQTVRLTIDDTCHPVEINTFNDPECGTESPTQAAQPDNTGAIVAGVVTVLIIAIISVTVVVIVILIQKNRRANISLQRKGDPVKWSEVAKSGEITIAGCAAYGAVHQQPESHDYEIPENYVVISQTDNPPAEAVYEPIPGDSQ